MEMRITLSGFKCYLDETSIEFPDNQLILFKGESGVGKSTIFQAIQWILYGGGSHVYPHNYTGKTWGKLELPQMTIRRQKRPEKLTVDDLEDDVAQAKIIKHFGTKESWISTSYIHQKGRCLLLSASNSEKMDLLVELAFAQDNPEKYLSKIETEYHNSKVKMEANLQQYETHLQFIQPNLDKIDLTQILTDPETVATELQASTQELVQIRPKLQLHHQSIGKYQTLQDSKSNLESSLTETEDPKPIRDRIELVVKGGKRDQILSALEAIPDEIEAYIKNGETALRRQILENELAPVPDNLKEVLEQIPKRISELTTGLEQIKLRERIKLLDIDESIPEITQSQYLELRSWIDRYTESRHILTTYKVEDVPGRIAILEQRQSPKIQIAKQLQDLTQKIGVEPSEAEIDRLRLEIEKIEASLDVHRCPHCQKSVRLCEGKLVNSSQSPCQKLDLVAKKKLYQDYLSKNKLIIQRNSLLFDNWQDYLQIEPLTDLTELTKLRQWVQVDSPPCDRPTLDHYQRNSEKIRERQKLQSELKEIDLSILINPEEELQNLRGKYEKYQSWDRLEKKFRTELEELRQKSPMIITESELGQARQHLAKKTLLLKELKEIGDGERFPDWENEVATLRTKLGEIEMKIMKNKEITKQLMEINRQLSQLVIDENLPGRCEKLELECEQLTEKLNKHREVNGYYQEYLRLQDFHKIASTSRERTVQLYELKELATEVECSTLQSTVDSFNSVLEEVVNHLFEKPMSIKLSLYKNLKSKNMIRTQVNFKINYKGGEYDHVNQLSGGEEDRVSVAVMLALARLHGSPLLLLDETFSSLDSQLKDLAVKVLRHTVGTSKTVIVTGHEMVEGIYDDIVEKM